MKRIETEDAVGQMLCHDMTQIIKGEYKDARFRKGHIVTEGKSEEYTPNRLICPTKENSKKPATKPEKQVV